jgi:hypothetical protein
VAQGRSDATYMAECFWPDVHQESVEQAARRIRRSIAELTAEAGGVELIGAILLPVDEVVFYLFNGDSANSVGEACQRAEVAFERVLEAVELE